MTIQSIACGKNTITIKTDIPDGANATVAAFVPLINAEEREEAVVLSGAIPEPGGRFPGRKLCEENVVSKNGLLTIPRNDGFDLLVARFCVSAGGGLLSGVKYVTDFLPGFSECAEPVPEISRPLGTWCIAPDEDIEYMRFGVMMDELDEAWLLANEERPDDIIHVWNGREYRFNREVVELHDSFLSKLGRKGIPTLLRFINRKNYQLFEADDAFFRKICHPGYEDDFEGVEMSAVNLRTEESFSYYCACLDFIFCRYASPGSPYGVSYIMDIGNEINSARIWHNAGKMECDAFIEEYSVALRLAWLLSQKYRPGYRVDVSLELNFTKRFVDDPLHYYKGRDCVSLLAACTKRDGDFFWGVSAHPYPEVIENPDFYNDTLPEFSLDTKIISMKNMEVWPAFLSLPEISFNGVPRRVLFDEQGFNTRADDPDTEVKGACAFILAYLKVRQNPGIDMFLINRDVDLGDADEYGLRLGLRYFGGYKDRNHIFPAPGRRKLICDAIAATDSEKEAEWVEFAREKIGRELFDSLLTPPPVTSARS